MQIAIKSTPATLHVVTAVVNPCRYESRYKLYLDFADHVRASGALLTTVEGVFGARPPMIPDAIHVPVQDELWHKENLLNLGIHRLPLDAKYVAWVDADVEFVQSAWAGETVEALQHYDILQPWSSAVDLGPQKLGGHAVETHESFGYMFATGQPIMHKVGADEPYKFAHPGFAWAARRDALDKFEGLIDWTLLGAADHMMALALIGRSADSMASGLHPNYYAQAGHWAYMARQLRQNLGYVPGLIHHHWHGRKANRQYVDRWEILKDNQYDPRADIMRDSYGVIRLTGNKPKLRDDLRRYFRQRQEDSQDL